MTVPPPPGSRETASLDRQPAPALSRAAVDRSADHRTDRAWLAEAWSTRGQVLLLDGEYRVLVTAVPEGVTGTGLGSERLTDGGPPPRLHLRAAQGELPEDILFLGDDGTSSYFAQRVENLPAADDDAPDDAADHARPALLREIGAALDDRDAGLLVHAVALLTWLDRSVHCPRCGAETEVRAAGSLRTCPVDGSEHHPRTDPAMIVLVTSPDGEQAVLGRNRGWPDGLYSCLAGFVEPGESAEQSVVREVAEEAGLHAYDLRYTGSQPWPFPSSLMLAYTAVADVGEVRPDPVELDDARWFGREELRTALRDGTVWAPPSVSIARRLIDSWLAGPA